MVRYKKSRKGARGMRDHDKIVLLLACLSLVFLVDSAVGYWLRGKL